MDSDRKYRQNGYMDSGESKSFREDRPKQQQGPRPPLDVTGPRLPRLVQHVAASRCFNCATTLPAGTDLTNGYSGFPSRVYIGEAAEGDSVTKTFTITNRGDAPMTINSVRMGDVGIFDVDTSGMLTNVPAGGSTTFTVSFYPWEPGEHADELLVSAAVPPGCFGLNLGYFQVIVTGIGL